MVSWRSSQDEEIGEVQLAIAHKVPYHYYDHQNDLSSCLQAQKGFLHSHPARYVDEMINKEIIGSIAGMTACDCIIRNLDMEQTQHN